MSDIPGVVRSIMESQRFAVLATQGTGVPYTNLVAFSFADTLRYIYFITPSDSTKFRNMRANPYVSLFIDNRVNRGSDIVSAVGISATGIATALDDEMKEDLLGPFLERHPDLEEFAWAPENVLVSVGVTRYTVVRQFSQVEVIDPQAFTL
jgi:nitroimidazol reductase NimA-like FMN-containing flavoprotein (pyridoxamine 5'-phosphate oxidase superfamily)